LFYHLPDDLVHVSGFGGDDLCVLELYTMLPVEGMFYNSQPVWLSEADQQNICQTHQISWPAA
jgi:hypothetical protein